MKTRYLFFWLALLPVFSFCVNPAQVIENETVEEISEDIKYAVERYRELSNDGSIDDSFLFFTDPHLLDYNNNFGKETKDKLVASFSSAKEVYNYLSLGFCLCGGDWLIQGDTQAIAKEKLLFADTTMKSMFSHYYKVMGNHDTNYQGIVSDDDPRRGDFSRDYIDNTYFTETGSSYYSFMGKTTRFYILDSGLDYTTNMNDFRWEQLLWLADQLQYHESEHQVLCIHMFYFIGKLVPMSEVIISLCDAYNSKTTIDLNGKTFDYSSTIGSIHVILSGHTHEDVITLVGENRNIPVIQTTRFINRNISTFDICLLNYKENLIHLVRVGSGESRQVELYNNGVN